MAGKSLPKLTLGIQGGQLVECDFRGRAYPVAASTAAEIMHRYNTWPKLLNSFDILVRECEEQHGGDYSEERAIIASAKEGQS